MEKIINYCQRLLNLTQCKHVRSMMQKVNWNSQLIAIRGAKGVGKTTLMLQYIKLHGGNLKKMLYASLDHNYFTQHSLLEFVEQFYRQGGEHLFLDEVHKYATWSKEVKEIYDTYPDLKVVISGSSLLSILNGDADLSRRCVPYEMQGLSFREYLELAHGLHFDIVSLKDLLNAPEDICIKVNEQCRPLSYFDEYLKEGYYPFFLEGKEEYFLRVENVVNYIIEVELPALCNVDVSNVRKLKALVAVLSSNVPMQLDMQKLSTIVGVSRVTLLGYLQYLNKARILNLLYSNEINIKKLQKPDKIFVENPNIMQVMTLDTVNAGTVRESFMVNQLQHGHKVEYSPKGDLLVDGKFTVEIGGMSKDGKQIANVENAYIAADNIEYCYGNKIPLWAFGFLY
ncbi:MAG: ATP-binding protein [Alloprevotella sp.]